MFASIHSSKLKYGFVTFVRPCDAYTAIDDSPKNSAIRHYDISFGGRRAFCREKYFDLGGFSITLLHSIFDSIQSKTNHNAYIFPTDNSGHGFREEKISPQKAQMSMDNDDSFDVLLRKVKEKIQEKK